jgi:hypothetical protein
MARTMPGVVIGCSPTLNALLVYNPRIWQSYKPDGYWLACYRLPSLVYPSLRYDRGLCGSLLRDDTPPLEERYPPDTRVERVDPATTILLAGTVLDISFPLDTLGVASIDPRIYGSVR